MSNGYYTSPTDIEPLTKALSADINDIDAAIDNAFDKLPSESELKRGTVTYAVDSGATNAYVIALPYTPSGYVDGLNINFRPTNTNTGASTVNVNGLGVKSIKRLDGSTLSPGDITVGCPIAARYSTATGYFHIAGNSAVDASAAAASAAAALVSQNAASTSASNANSSAIAAAASELAAASSAEDAASATAIYWNDLAEFGGVADGSADNATAITNACASGAPVFVPKGASFYSTTTLSEANRALLWGPGVVKVSGVETPIALFPSLSSNTQGVMNLRRTTLAPTNNVTNGSVGLGVIHTNITRSGGYGQYGNWLSKYLVSAAVPTGQFDVGATSWVTMTNLTGGQCFAKWSGANTPAVNLGQTYSGGAVVGDEINAGNRWADFGLQYDVGGTRYTVGQQIVPDVLPSEDGTNTVTVTMSSGTPGLVNLTAHGYTANMGVVFGGGGTLPTELTAGTCYYVSATGLTANAFAVSATLGGTAINFAAGSSGTVNVLPSYPGSFAQAIGASIWGHQWWVGTLIRGNTIAAGGIAHIAKGGSVAAGKPAFWLQLRDHWARGIDFTNATLSDNIALQMSAGHTIYFGTASMSGSGTGSWAVSTGGTGNTGALYSDNFAAVNLRWSRSGGVATLGLYGATPVAQSTGYGTPTNGAKSASFDATTIVHLDLAKVVAQLIIDLKSLGVFAA